MENTKSQLWLKKRKEAGLCLQCSSKSGPTSKLYCTKCADKKVIMSKNRQTNLTEKGLCIQCMCPLLQAEGRRCNNCNEKNNLTRNNKVSQRLKDGLCVKCGKHQCIAGNTRCSECSLKHSSCTYFNDISRWKELSDLLELQNKRCPYTGRQISVGVDAEIDHIIPRSKGGRDEIDNLQWVHKDVNRMKNDKNKKEFLSLIKEIYCYSINIEV